jgi:hypothetical protein
MVDRPPFRMSDLDPATREKVNLKARAMKYATQTILDVIGPKLPADRIDRHRESAEAGAWDLVLDSVCATLVKGRIPLTVIERDLVVETLEIFGSNWEPRWYFLSDHEGVLAGLTVIDDDGHQISPPPGFDAENWWPRGYPAKFRWGRVGGHLHGLGIPHKTVFPPDWDADKINAVTLDVARNPEEVPEQDRNGGWITRGVREDVHVEVRLRPTGPIITGYPISGPGVHHNDADGGELVAQPRFYTPHHGPTAQKRAEINDLHTHCTRLTDALAPRLPDLDERRVRTGLAVGEWLYLLDDLCAALAADHIPITATEHALLTTALDRLGAGDDTAPHVRDRDTLLPTLTIAH